MLFPRERMQVVTSYQGRTSDEGWLVLDFSKIDNEGISKVYVDIRDIRRLQEQKGEQADLVKRTLDLLSTDED